MLKLRKLKATLAVADAHSFAGAANLMNMSQPAITRAVQSLEDELEIRLFYRKSRYSGLTEAGDILTRRIRRAQRNLKLAESELQSLGAAPPGFRPSLAQHAADHEFAALLAIAARGSISAAARAVGPSQPALNKSLKMLENRTACLLFHRTSHGMRLTPAGEILLRRSKLALSEIRQAVEEIAFFKGQGRGRIRVGALPLTRVRMVPRAVETLVTHYPEAEIAIVDGTYEVLLHALNNGDIDILAGTIRKPALIDGLVSEELFQDDVAIVASATHPLATNPDCTLADCLNYDWILPFKGVPLRNKFEQTLASVGLSAPTRIIEADSIVAVRSLLLSGPRLAILSRHQVHFEVSWGALAILPVRLKDAMRPVGITTRGDFEPTPLAQVFLTALREASLRYAAPDAPGRLPQEPTGFSA
ncbi:LysR family transcriptional regulator [Roseibium sp.]|uniref:LysR family transcriptional regulator n=1 Tax=Roseibium sp. TaxID=1936156 RepID=UPI003A97D4D6